MVGHLSLIIISLTSPVGARCPCDRCGGDCQSDNIISHFTCRCEAPLRSVWWDTQSDYNISHFTHRCGEPLRLVWWDTQSDYNISHFTYR